MGEIKDSSSVSNMPLDGEKLYQGIKDALAVFELNWNQKDLIQVTVNWGNGDIELCYGYKKLILSTEK